MFKRKPRFKEEVSLRNLRACFCGAEKFSIDWNIRDSVFCEDCGATYFADSLQVKYPVVEIVIKSVEI